MKRLTNLALLSTGLVFALFACRGGGGDDTTGDDVMPDGPQGSVKVKDVQNDAMPDGTAVELRGVVITAIDGYGDRTGDIWVQDADGGAFSGIKMFGVSPDQLLALTVGDIVDVTNAEKDEFKYMPMTGMGDEGSVTELKGAAGGVLTVTKKGAGTVPAPAMVDAKAIAAMDKATRDAEWEKWEGVLIKVVNARQLAASRSFGTGPDQNEFRISGVARVQSAMAALNTDNAFGLCYDSIVGVGDHFFNDLVLPRSTADLVSGGNACNPMPTTIIQTQTTAGSELANLTAVVVTAIDNVGSSKGFWAQDALQGAASNGVYVFIGSGNNPPVTIPAGIVVGAKVDIQGAVEEFGGTNSVTEISGPPVLLNIVAAGAPPVPATTATVAQLSDLGANGEPWEGVLVGLTQPLKVTASLANGKWELTANNGDKIIMDDESFQFPTSSPPPQAPAMGKCYTAAVGVMHVQTQDNLRTLNPRQATDLTVGTGCN